MPDHPERHDAERLRRKYGGGEAVCRQVAARFDVRAGALGKEKVVMRAGKLGALKLMRSATLGERVLALQRLGFGPPTLQRTPPASQYKKAIAEIEDALADIVAQRTVEDEVERRVNEKMEHRHAEYVRELKVEALREAAGPETPATQRRLDDLRALDGRRLNSTALDALRPKSLAGIVGQESAIAALLAKLASPFPQHVILYGPPGVGKTTVARLALELAKKRTHTPFAAD